MLVRLGELIGSDTSQYIDCERVATTPESFWHAVTSSSPYAGSDQAHARGGLSARDAFNATLTFLREARAPGDVPVTFLSG